MEDLRELLNSGSLKELLNSGIKIDGKIILDIIENLEKKADTFEKEGLNLRAKAYNTACNNRELYYEESKMAIHDSKSYLVLAIEIKKAILDALVKDKYAEITADDFADITTDSFDYENAWIIDEKDTCKSHLNIALIVPDSLREKLAEMFKNEVDITDNRCVYVRYTTSEKPTFSLFDEFGNEEVDVTDLFTQYGVDKTVCYCSMEITCHKRNCTVMEKSTPNYAVLEDTER